MLPTGIQHGGGSKGHQRPTLSPPPRQKVFNFMQHSEKKNWSNGLESTCGLDDDSLVWEIPNLQLQHLTKTFAPQVLTKQFLFCSGLCFKFYSKKTTVFAQIRKK